jgi:hypothetical protein
VTFCRFPSTHRNRTVKNHRPILMLLILLLLLGNGLRLNTNSVLANPGVDFAKVTATPEQKIILPASGEPFFLMPGNNARLTSPIMLKLVTRPGEDGMVRIDLLGHDNRLIYRSTRDYTQYRDNTILIEEEIPFEVRSDESARLQVILENLNDKTVYLASVDVTLLLVKGTESTGDSPVNPRLIIEEPVPGNSVTSEKLEVKGKIKLINDNPIIFEVLTDDWLTLTSKIISVPLPIDKTAFASFDVKLPLYVKNKTPVTIRIHQESKGLITGPVFTWSEKVDLFP